MSTGVDQELKAAFETASDFVQPRADLAEQGPHSSRARRGRLAITIAAVTAFAARRSWRQLLADRAPPVLAPCKP